MRYHNALRRASIAPAKNINRLVATVSGVDQVNREKRAWEVFTHAPIRIYNRAEEQSVHYYGESKTKLPPISPASVSLFPDIGCSILYGRCVFTQFTECCCRLRIAAVAFYVTGLLRRRHSMPISPPCLKNPLAYVETEAISSANRAEIFARHGRVIALLRLNNGNLWRFGRYNADTWDNAIKFVKKHLNSLKNRCVRLASGWERRAYSFSQITMTRRRRVSHFFLSMSAFPRDSDRIDVSPAMARQ